MMLPSGWTYCEVADIAADGHGAITDGPFGSSLKSSDYTCSGVRIIRLGNIGPRKFIDNNEAFVDESRFQELRRHEACAGDLVTAALGEPLGRTAPVPPAYGPAIVKADCFRLRPSARVEKNLILYWLNSPTILRSFLDRSQGIGRARINLGTFRTTKLPLPPLAEQRRIVNKLDTLSARIAHARGELVRVPTLVRRMKRQALSSCFAAAPDRSSVLLGSILKSIQAGKNLRCEERPPRPGEFGVVKVSAVSSGTFCASEAKTLPIDYAPPGSALIRKGDMLLARASGSRTLVGRVAIVQDDPGRLYLSDKILRLDLPLEVRDWCYWFLCSPQGREQIEEAAQGISMHNITQDALRALHLSLPGASERASRIAKLTAAFARADHLEAEATRAATLLDRLEGSILNKAFNGELVPQDATDEPAAALLDRIRAERAAAPKARRGRGATGHAEAR